MYFFIGNNSGIQSYVCGRIEETTLERCMSENEREIHMKIIILAGGLPSTLIEEDEKCQSLWLKQAEDRFYGIS